jgi:DNA-binding NarL/FixJ family response regulator
MELETAARSAAAAAERALSFAGALDEALAVLAEARDDPDERPPRNRLLSEVELSPRERDVLALVAEGRSNKAIAEQLFVSPNTIKTHVASLLHKLHADTRVQLAALAVRGALP